MEQGNGKIVSPLDSWPYEANMRVALRRTLRVNEREGMLIEDLGVIPTPRSGLTERARMCMK